MKQAPTAIISMASMVICLAFIGAKSQAQSVQADKGPVTLTASLAGSSTVAFGEPILLRYNAKNTGALPVRVSLTDVPGDTLGTETFTEAGGRPLVPSASLLVPHYKSETFTLDGGVDLAGNSSKSWEALASTRIAFPHPVNYVLRVHVERPYVVGDREQGTRYVLKGNFAFPLTVVAADPTYLRTTAEKLSEHILRTTDAEEKSTLVQALFSMPELTASSSWQALIEEPKLDSKTLNEIGTALEGRQTNRAADLLAEMFWEPVQSHDTIVESSVYQHFYGMYDAGTPAVRKHIEDLHKQHGATISHFKIE